MTATSNRSASRDRERTPRRKFAAQPVTGRIAAAARHAPRPPRAGGARPRDDRARSIRRRRWRSRASSPCSSAADLPMRAKGRDRMAQAARPFSEVVFAGHPVALVVAESPPRRHGRGGARGGPARAACPSSSIPRPRWILPRRSRASSSPPRATGPDRWTPRPTPGSAGEGTRRSTPSTSPATSLAAADTGTAMSRRSRFRNGRSRGSVLHVVGLPGLPRAAGLQCLGGRGRHARRRDRDAGGVRNAGRGVEGPRHPVAAASGSSARRWAGRSAGSGRCSTRSSPLPLGSCAGTSASS